MLSTFFACLAAVIVARAAELALGYWLAVRRQRRMRELLSAMLHSGSGVFEYVPPASSSDEEPPTEMN